MIMFNNINFPFSLYFLPHQDDEFFFLTSIENDLKNNIQPILIFLTSGGEKSLVRNNESLLFLKKTLNLKENIYFLGDLLSISDGKLIYHMKNVIDFLIAHLTHDLKKKYLKTIHCPAWEGGHQDHDAAFVIACSFFHLLGSKFEVPIWQHPIYSGHLTFWKFFSIGFVPSLLVKNKIAYNIKALTLLPLIFKSQIKTWFGLLPFMYLRSLFPLYIYRNDCKHNFVFKKPHRGKLLYERYHRFKFDQFMDEANKFFSQLGINLKCIPN
jgi:hypothetical protein